MGRFRSRAALLAAAFAALVSQAAAAPHRVLTFDDLDGWGEDDHAAALAAFTVTCDKRRGPDWAPLCAWAKTLAPEAARGFFEAAFRPVIAGEGATPLLTGYYEPELRGSRRRTARHRYPLHARPREGHPGRRLTRGQIEETGALRGLEIAWVEDPVEALFLGVQGSGRIRLAEGGTLRLGFDGANGHPRRSVGQEMVRRGILEPTGASAAAIGAWVRANPTAGRALLRHDPSYVFFREVEGLPDEAGPLGALRRPLTAGRSAAVDRRFVPLGAPIWVEKDGAEPMRRLMVAQDTGSAIRGPQRADLFYGTGAEAGRRAGRVRDRGRIVTLLPIRLAYRLAPDPLANATPRDDLPIAAAPAVSPPPPGRPRPGTEIAAMAPVVEEARPAAGSDAVPSPPAIRPPRRDGPPAPAAPRPPGIEPAQAPRGDGALVMRPPQARPTGEDVPRRSPIEAAIGAALARPVPEAFAPPPVGVVPLAPATSSRAAPSDAAPSP